MDSTKKIMVTTRQIIALNEVKDCGASTIRQIVSRSNQLNQSTLSDSELIDFINDCLSEGIKRSRLKHLQKEDFYTAISYADRIIEKSAKQGIMAISYVDSLFPSRLLNTVNEEGKSDVPLILYYKGNLDVANLNSIAIIGTREPTREGVKAGEYFGEKLAECGYNIVSGLASGCDTAGHKGALKCPTGVTTAFLAHGLDSVYPQENELLASEIVERGGLLMSEYPIGKTVNRYFLVARDRLQAALADATIVIQTGIHGGTNHAANTTLIANKPLFCVKYGNDNLMNHEKVAGNRALVSKGAHYITSLDYEDLVDKYLNKQVKCDAPNKNKEAAQPVELSLFPPEEI